MSQKQKNEIKESFDAFRSEILQLCNEIRLLKKENKELTERIVHLKYLENKAQETVIKLNNELINLKTSDNVVKVKEKFDMEFAR